MKHLIAVFVIAVLSVVCCSVATAQQEFSSESGTWTFTMPAGWQPMSREMVAKINDRYKKENPDHPSKAVAGFVKSGGLFEYPQIVLQVLETDMSKLSWEGLGRMLRDGSDDSPAAESAAVVADLIDCNGATSGYDIKPGLRQVGAKGNVALENGTKLETASRAFLHSGGVVQLAGLDILNRDPGSAQRQLDAFASSMRIANAHEFAAAQDVAPKPRRSSGSYSGGTRYGYYGSGGGVVVVIAVIVRILLRLWIRRD